ncbi:MAG: hypothetical protein PHF86_11340 [Candidatus Nanoarchaeia archaeon]|nr:hypothetical protein [Candidatus Nanoarchaeia archaeon]
MNKKAVSPLIATVLIIGFTIVLAAMVMQWGGGFVRSLTEQQGAMAEAQTKCLNINFEIAVDTTVPTAQKVKITNNADNTISKFLVQKIKADGSSEEISTITDDLIGYGSTSVTVPSAKALVSGDKVRVIPYVQLASGEDYGCSTNAAKEYTIPA